MSTPVKRVERSPSPIEAPQAPEPDAKKRAVDEDEAMPAAVPFPGLLEVQSGIAAISNSPRTIDIETLLGMLQQEVVPNFIQSSLSAQMVVKFFSTEAVSALLTLQSMPTICPSFVQSYFEWEEAAAEHVTKLWYDIDIDSPTTMTRLESALLRFLPLCKNLKLLKLNISGQFAEGAVLMVFVQRVLEKLPAQVNEIGLFIDMGKCSDQHPYEFANILDPLMLSLISRQQLCAVELDVMGDFDFCAHLAYNDTQKMISMHPRPFHFKIIERDYNYDENELFQYKYVQEKEWEECAELYNEMVADPQQAQACSLLIADKLFPKSCQTAPRHIGIAVNNEVLTECAIGGTLENMLPIDRSIKQGVIWCEYNLLKQSKG
jgi:hypothetical protein